MSLACWLWLIETAGLPCLWPCVLWLQILLPAVGWLLMAWYLNLLGYSCFNGACQWPGPHYCVGWTPWCLTLWGGGGGGGGDCISQSSIFKTKFQFTIIFAPLHCAGNFSSILLLILCAFKWCVECLYRHISFKKIHAPTSRSLKKIAPQVWNGHHACIDYITPKLVCVFPKHLAVISMNGFYCRGAIFLIRSRILDTPFIDACVSYDHLNLGCKWSDLDVGACIFFKKMCLWRHSTHHLKAHRISKNMVLRLPTQR